MTDPSSSATSTTVGVGGQKRARLSGGLVAIVVIAAAACVSWYWASTARSGPQDSPGSDSIVGELRSIGGRGGSTGLPQGDADTEEGRSSGDDSLRRDQPEASIAVFGDVQGGGILTGEQLAEVREWVVGWRQLADQESRRADENPRRNPVFGLRAEAETARLFYEAEVGRAMKECLERGYYVIETEGAVVGDLWGSAYVTRFGVPGRDGVTLVLAVPHAEFDTVLNAWDYFQGEYRAQLLEHCERVNRMEYDDRVAELVNLKRGPSFIRQGLLVHPVNKTLTVR